MVFGAGYTSADDVVAHELAHGVIQHTAGLVYWYQSGAINESMADVVGELVDLADGTGSDGARAALAARRGPAGRGRRRDPGHGRPAAVRRSRTPPAAGSTTTPRTTTTTAPCTPTAACRTRRRTSSPTAP